MTPKNCFVVNELHALQDYAVRYPPTIAADCRLRDDRVSSYWKLIRAWKAAHTGWPESCDQCGYGVRTDAYLMKQHQLDFDDFTERHQELYINTREELVVR